MPSCILRYCQNYSGKTTKPEGVSYHIFVRPGHEKREEWIKFVQNERREEFWLPSQFSYICSKHFRAEDIKVTKTGRRYLKKNAVPCENPNAGDENRTPTPTSLEDVHVSDSESIFDSPKTINLKKDLREASNVNCLLSNKLKKLKRQNKYLKDRNKKLSDIVNNIKSKFSISAPVEMELLKKAEAVDAYVNMMKKTKKPKTKPNVYSPCIRKFAMTVNYYSPAAYKYIRRVYNNALPHPKVLSQWYGSIDAEPGFTEEAFNALKLKCMRFNKPIICSLMFDEMSIRPQKLFKNKKLGSVDFGTGPQDEKATQVLVFMLVSLTENWKIPIGYFFTAGISAETKAGLIKTCLEKCHSVGVSVATLVIDGCQSNLTAVELLGADLSNLANMKTYFRHPSTEDNVHIFVDACKVIKLMRNTFENRKVFYDEEDKIIKWQLLVNLNKLQQSEGLRFDNKISQRHIHFRNEIMRVKLATELFSVSIANALKLCDTELKSSRFENSEGTVNFITLINNLFDVLNSKKCNCYGLRRPLDSKNYKHIFEFLDKVRKYLLSLRVYVKSLRRINIKNKPPKIIMGLLKKSLVETKSKTGFLQAVICIDSLKNVYHDLVEGNKISYISTYRLSQDHLELFFRCIRNHGEQNDNPNVTQFRAAYKKSLCYLELRSSFTGNCIPLDNFTISSTSSVDIINSKTNNENFQILNNDKKKFGSDIEANTNCVILAEKLNDDKVNYYVSTASKLIVGYISGNVSRLLLNKLKCEECINHLITNTKLWHHKLINIRDMGGLCYSSQGVYQICLKTETFIRSLIKESGEKSLPTKYCDTYFIISKVLETFLDSDIFKTLAFHSSEQPATFNHRIHLVRAVIEIYTNIRLHHEDKINPEIPSKTRRQKLRKLILFTAH